MMYLDTTQRPARAASLEVARTPRAGLPVSTEYSYLSRLILPALPLAIIKEARNKNETKNEKQFTPSTPNRALLRLVMTLVS